jgi:RNA polymerase sigma-70 factor (ECF subfamily)
MGLRQVRRLPVALTPEAIEAVEAAFVARDRLPSGREDALRHCVDRLPDKSRLLVRLRYRESLKVAEIAERIGSSTDAVQKALTRLRDALQKCVQRRMRAQWEGA